MNDKVYDALKRLAQLGLPAFGALYFGLSQIWGFPHGEEVVGTLALLATFLGALIQLSSSVYSAGQSVANPVVGDIVYSTTDEGRPAFVFEFEEDPADLMNKQSATFTIRRQE